MRTSIFNASHTSSVLFETPFVDIDECATIPCQNGGSCIDQINGYSCNCDDGYNGTNCENGNCQTLLHHFKFDLISNTILRYLNYKISLPLHIQSVE